MKTLKPNSKIYFMGICGTGMAAVAGLCKQAGFEIIGSDEHCYPPMSTMLEQLKISVLSPYSPKHLEQEQPDLVVIANALSKGHPEIQYVLNNNIPYTSFAELVGEQFLKDRTAICVAGTHGKTTTTSLSAYLLDQLDEHPSFIIGGVPKNFPQSFHLGTGKTFVIEGDEYDTAFFDKGPKFLHYYPMFLILTNIEFDHADIYESLEKIELQFEKLCALVKNPKNIIANVDDPGVAKLLNKTKLYDQITAVSTKGQSKTADIILINHNVTVKDHRQIWQGTVQMNSWGKCSFQTSLSGSHNLANITQVLGLMLRLEQEKIIAKVDLEKLSRCIETFKGVTRRLDHLGHFGGIDVYEDFAHHPTAIREVIAGFRKAYPQKRLIVAFEPKNATARRNIFTKEFAQSLALADLVFIGKCPLDMRIPENQRMDTAILSKAVGSKAKTYDDNQALLNDIAGITAPGDAVIFMSSGSFSGVQYQLVEQLKIKHFNDK